MTGSVSYSVQIGDWTVTTTIDPETAHQNWVSDANSDEDASYPATVTVRPADDANPDNDELRVVGIRQATVTETTPDKDSKLDNGTTAAVHQYEVTNTGSSTRSVVKARVKNDDLYLSKAVHLPKAYSLMVLDELRQNPEMTGKELMETIRETYPQENPRTAAHLFDRACEQILPPEDYLPIGNTLIEGCQPLRGYRDDPSKYIAKHAFELTPRAYPDGEPDRYVQHIRLYNSQVNLPSTNTENVLRAALFRAFENDGSVHPSLSRIKTGIPGESWTDGLCNANVWILCVLLHDNGDEEMAQNIAQQLRETVTVDEYDEAKRDALRVSDQEQSYRWGELLPTAARCSTHEYLHILGNLAYWVGGDINTQHRESDHASTMYRIAEGLLHEHGGESYAHAARARMHYTAGLYHLHESRETEAAEEFKTVISECETGPRDLVDVYSVYGSCEQLVKLSLREVRDGSLDVESTIETLQWVKEALPSQVIVPSRSIPRHGEIESLIDGGLSELTGRKLEGMQSPEEPVPTDAQVLSQYESARDAYEQLDSQHDERVAEGCISEFQQSISGDDPVGVESPSDTAKSSLD